MNEDQIVSSGSSVNPSDSGDETTEDSGERVFDISNDLNISPMPGTKMPGTKPAPLTTEQEREEDQRIKREAFEASLNKELSGDDTLDRLVNENRMPIDGGNYSKPIQGFSNVKTVPLAEFVAPIKPEKPKPAVPPPAPMTPVPPPKPVAPVAAPAPVAKIPVKSEPQPPEPPKPAPIIPPAPLPNTPAAATPSQTTPSQIDLSRNITGEGTPSDSIVKRLRTYESDMAEVLRSKGLSQASIAIAENKKTTGSASLGAKPLETPKPAAPIAPPPTPKPAATPIVPPTVSATAQPSLQERMAAFTAKPAPVVTPPPKPMPAPMPISASPGAPTTAQIQAQLSASYSEPQHRSYKTALYIAISIIMIVGGGIAGYYLYSISPLATSASTSTPQQSFSISNLVTADKTVYIPSEGSNASAITAKIRSEIAKSQPANTIKSIVITRDVLDTQGKLSSKIQVPAKDILSLLSIPAPDVLTRSLTPAWMLGVYTDQKGTKSTFVVTTENFFQNAFAGMLQWETTMPDDLKTYLYDSTTLTTNSTAKTFTIRGHYEDRIIRNKDVRAYVADDGHIVFLYSFVDNAKLVITNSEAALGEIITRLDKQAFVR